MLVIWRERFPLDPRSLETRVEFGPSRNPAALHPPRTTIQLRGLALPQSMSCSLTRLNLQIGIVR